ncbi:nitric oxide reductase transcriptional regulator NorR [Comamonas sp. 17RB]|uniref:nitric oxide reductase transcriptional regulator NorR n=1 Tax=Comamonas sp. 17RB TaxID=3047025 RepID=UPI0024B8589D|nr:nitric oxide reductase transcriptional regulator NorR [Comamonas sp. 17RB]MDI9854344.1 nitric oxide reductase transcriptional regulator NorR [Comamonas sp. 17RB]
MLDSLVLSDLSTELPQAVRLQRLVESLQAEFHCGAVALLRLEGECLRPVAAAGLVQEALGRRFTVSQHPRLATILSRSGELTRFHHDSSLPDPYDGLLTERAGQALPVHDCMGLGISIEGWHWGVITLDALDIGTFDDQAQERLQARVPLIEATVRMAHLESEVRALRLSRSAQPSDATPAALQDIVGQSPALLRLQQELAVVAETDMPVLLLGETGVGKELFARRLHQLSRRRQQPMVHVNCAALPDTLAESELFGHARGAFSGAVAARAGRFESADQGTLFLDEVGELTLPVQAKLLRALQNGEIQRLGADQPRKVDVRIIAATNRALNEQVRDGGFRADLFHRLSVYPLHVPPLRERGDDVLLLAGRFLELNRSRLGLRSLRLTSDAQLAMRRYAWPGNVRELEHVISRAALKAVSYGARRTDIVSLDAASLDLEAAPLSAPALAPGAALPGAMAGQVSSTFSSLREQVDHVQRSAIEQALGQHQGVWSAAAKSLQIDSSNLHKLARRLGIKG